MKAFNEIVRSNHDEDIKELRALKDWYTSQAAMASSAEYGDIANAYLDIVLNLEKCIQGLDCIPSMYRRV